MAVAQRTRDDIDAVCALLECSEEIAHVNFAGARQFHVFDVRRIFPAECARRVRRHIAAKDAAERGDVWFKAVVVVTHVSS